MNMDYKGAFLRLMIESKALAFGDFVTKSGRRSPYFINAGAFNTGGLIGKLGGFYAACIAENMECEWLSKDVSAIFGPAYKGIPLAVSASIALSKTYGMDVGYCFNRKEAKDHGEGGSLVGTALKAGDKVIVVDDVLTAGTAIRETLPLLRKTLGVHIAGLVIAVDRMERGTGELSAANELRRDFGIEVFPLLTLREIVAEIGNKIGEDNRERMEKYMTEFAGTGSVGAD